MVELTQVSRGPAIDGKLDDAVWSALPVYTSFVAGNPHLGEPAKLDTEVRVCYDERHLYVGFRCLDPQPQKIEARNSIHDALRSGDTVFLLLDTFDDNRSGYFFRSNAAGAQYDAHIEDNGRTWDGTWDATWYSAGSIDDHGWQAEMAIPFRELRFPRGGFQRIGINFGRYCQHEQETSQYSPPGRNDEYQIQVSRCASGIGLNSNLELGRGSVVPTFVARLRTEPGGSRYSGTTSSGINGQFHLTPNILLDLTANPDFGEVSADPTDVSLSRYEVYFPERRPFFVERNDAFSTPLMLFYSRRVGRAIGNGTYVPIDAGARITGKEQRVTFAALAVRTGETPFETSAGTQLEAPASYFALRTSLEERDSRKIGLLATSRQQSGANHSVVGLDGVSDLPGGWRTLGQVALSQSSERDDHDNGAGYLKLWKYQQNYRTSISLRGIGTGFDANAMGYVPWVGQTRAHASFSWTPRAPDHGIRRTSIGPSASFYRVEGDPEWSYAIQPLALDMSLTDGGFGASATLFSEYYAGETFRGRSWHLAAYTSSSKPVWISPAVGGGKDVDYNRGELIRNTWIQVPAGMRLGSHLTTGATYFQRWEKHPTDPANVTVSFGRFDTTLNFTNNIALYFQLQGVDYSFWSGPWKERVDFDMNTLVAIQEGGVRIYVGWNSFGTWNRNEKSRIVKVSYLGRF